MKKVRLTLLSILLLGAGLLFSFKLTNAEKEYNIKFNENQIQMLWSSLEFSKANLKTSQASSIDVTSVSKAIDSVQHLILIQYTKQSTDTTTKKGK